MRAFSVSRFEPIAFAALRIVAGFLFSFHGVQKVFGVLTSKPPPAFGSQLWLGGWIELVGGVLLALGLFTRYVALLCAGTMAVAYTQFHWKLALDGWQWLPIVNKGELAALYCFVFLFIGAHGPGVLSLDRRRGARRA